MKNILNMLQKFINKIKRDGIFKATKKACIKIYYDYLISLNPLSYIKFNKNKNDIMDELDFILNGDIDRIIVWRSSIGWSIPLFQRPQQLALKFAKHRTLVFFEVTKLTDDVDFMSEKEENLYLVNFSNKKFSKLFHEILNNIDKPKYLFTASTCWDLSDKVVMNYVSSGYKFLYDYLDELSPELAGTDKLPYNVETIHNYVINNPKDTFVICTADTLLNDIKNKRNSSENIIYVSNGVDYDHFTNLDKKINFTSKYKRILNNKKPIIGYYGALASWFDYDLIKYIAKNKKDANIVLIGSKYDSSFDGSGLGEYKNVHYIGVVDYNELPYYASKFDVCILPFKLNDITKSTNPIKIFEYMALEKPIVSTDLNECRKYDSVMVAKTKEEFINKIDLSLKSFKKNERDNAKKIALENTWDAKALDIINALTNYEEKYPIAASKNVTIAKMLYKLYSQSNRYNVNNSLENCLKEKKRLFLVTMNSEICMYAMKDDEYKEMVMNDEVLLVPDSISISYAINKIFGRKIKRYPGIEVLVYTLNQLNDIKGTIYLFGATKKVNKDMQEYIKKEFKNIKIIGYSDGYVKDYEKVKKDIMKLSPDLTVVALGVPAQEIFINSIYNKMDKGVFIGVGGALDVLSGNKKRAPLFMRKINLEWLYRIANDKKRMQRFYEYNIKFINDVRKGNTK